MTGKRPNFLRWYYDQGVHELLEIWKNFLLFTWRYFSIAELSGTLFYPWRRDVSSGNWRGLHPLKALGLFFENTVSRLLGASVRLAVICAGIAVSAAVLIAGLAASFLWISAPPAIAAILIYDTDNLFLAGGSFLLWASVSGFCYYNDSGNPPMRMGFDEFLKHPVFERVCGRLGIISKRFPKEIMASPQLLDDFLKVRGLTRGDYLRLVRWELSLKQHKSDLKRFWRWENLQKISPIGRQWRYGYTVHLDGYCQDLSEADRTEYASSRLIGRSDEYEILKLVIRRPDENCALIVGNPGIGRKTLIHSLSRGIRSGEERELAETRILVLDLGRAISDAVNQGKDVENFLRSLFREATQAGNIILVIEHLEHFLGQDSSLSHPDISAVLAEFLNRPSFRIIATSTPKEYHQLIEKHSQIVKYFEVIEMREPSEDETIDILLSQLEKYEQRRILFTFKALEEIVVSSGRYDWEFPLPERALDLAMDTLMFWEKKSDEQFVTEKTVAGYLTLKTGAPHGEVVGAERKKLLDLEAMLHRQVIGQDEAISQVAQALQRARSGIGNAKKPVGSFLFLGPTGVGKTETAKALARTYFGDESRMIRLDMSEFQTPSSIDRLLGSNHLNQPGRLAVQVKDNPYSLILLDEIEKAYPEILDIFLQILDEGFVTDAFGEKINFANTMIIATSNAGAALIKKMVENGSPAEETKQAVIDYVIENNIFRTEFLNRFGGVIFFRPLKGQEIRSVVRLELQKFARRVAKEKNINLAFDDGTVENIIQKGYDPVFGARSLNRYIEDTVETIVAKKIISGEAANGSKISISL